MSLLGTGGMAKVYRAEDLNLGREVALKMLSDSAAGNAEFRERFRREAKASAALVHPNIVQVYDFFESEEGVFIVMELVNGSDLRALLHKGRFSAAESVRIAADVLSALDFAHCRGIVHRDISSRNVLLADDGTVKVSDFGIAMIVGERTLTKTGELIGSVQYIAPEQANGGEATYKADIYSAGVLLYEMLTGRLPYLSDNVVKLALMHVQNPVPVPSAQEPSVPRFLDEIVGRAMAKRPEDRFASAEAMAKALRSGLTGNRFSGFSLAGPAVQAQAAATADNSADGETERTLLRPPISHNLKRMNADAVEVAGGGEGFSFTGESTVDVVDISAVDDEAEYEEYENFEGEEYAEYGEDAEDPEAFEYGDGYEEDEPPENSGGSLAYGGLKLLIITAAVMLLAFAGGVYWVTAKGPGEITVPNLIGQRLEEARASAEACGLRIEVKQQKYADGVAPSSVLSQDPQGGSAIADGSVVWVDISVGREYVNLPDFSGFNEERACRELNDLGLNFTVILKENKEIAAGAVLGQEPEPGVRLAVGSEVTLYVSKGDLGITLPDVSGKEARSAEAELKNLGLKAVIKPVPAPPGAKPGCVISQSPAAGSKMQKGQAVVLEICAQANKTQAAPDFVGKSIEEAENTAKKLNLILTVEGDRGTGASVTSQSVSPGAIISDGRLTVVCSAKIFVPNVCGADLESAIQTLNQAGLKLGGISAVSGGTPGTVVEQSPGAGEAAAKGTAVSLAVVQSAPEPAPAGAAAQPPAEVRAHDRAPAAGSDSPPSVQESIPVPVPTPSAVKAPSEAAHEKSEPAEVDDPYIPGDLP